MEVSAAGAARQKMKRLCRGWWSLGAPTHLLANFSQEAHGAIIETMSQSSKPSRPGGADRKRKRDRRVASLSVGLVPQENRRTTRTLNQALLAGELHDAIILCLKESKLMPTAALLRSLIDTCVLGIWLLRYAKDEEVPDSVAHLSTPEIVRNVFVGKDQSMFAFVFEEVKGTDHQFYRDVLHPSIHGDALHITMRLRDEKSRRTWVHKVIFHTNHVYVHFMLQFAESGLVPAQMYEYFKNESLKSLQMMTALLNHPDWKGTDERLCE